MLFRNQPYNSSIWLFMLMSQYNRRIFIYAFCMPRKAAEKTKSKLELDASSVRLTYEVISGVNKLSDWRSGLNVTFRITMSCESTINLFASSTVSKRRNIIVFVFISRFVFFFAVSDTWFSTLAYSLVGLLFIVLINSLFWVAKWSHLNICSLINKW